MPKRGTLGLRVDYHDASFALGLDRLGRACPLPVTKPACVFRGRDAMRSLSWTPAARRGSQRAVWPLVCCTLNALPTTGALIPSMLTRRYLPPRGCNADVKSGECLNVLEAPAVRKERKSGEHVSKEKEKERDRGSKRSASGRPSDSKDSRSKYGVS